MLLELKPGKICIASSDGSYSVYCNEFDNDQQEVEELLISSKAIKVLEGLNSVKMFYHKKAIGFENEELEVIITRSEDKFVDFRKVFPPDWPANTKVMKHELIEALGKCSLSSDLLKTTVFTLGEKQFDLMADDQYININVAMAADYTGDVKTIAINSDKLLKLLQQIEHSDIEMAIHDAKRAIVITCESDPGYRGMLMPIAV